MLCFIPCLDSYSLVLLFSRFYTDEHETRAKYHESRSREYVSKWMLRLISLLFLLDSLIYYPSTHSLFSNSILIINSRRRASIFSYFPHLLSRRSFSQSGMSLNASSAIQTFPRYSKRFLFHSPPTLQRSFVPLFPRVLFTSFSTLSPSSFYPRRQIKLRSLKSWTGHESDDQEQ